jgi:hypothetical protein
LVDLCYSLTQAVKAFVLAIPLSGLVDSLKSPLGFKRTVEFTGNVFFLLYRYYCVYEIQLSFTSKIRN